MAPGLSITIMHHLPEVLGFFPFFCGACSSFFCYVLMSFKALPFLLSFLCSCGIFPFEFNCSLQAGSFYVCHVLFHLESETVPGPCSTVQTQFSVKILDNLDLSPPQHYRCADVISPKDPMSLGNQIARKELIFVILCLKSRAAELF